MLGDLAKVVMWIAWFFFAFRLIDVGLRGQLGRVFTDFRGVAFLVEMLLLAAGAMIFMSETRRRNPGQQFLGGMLLITAGIVYRFNVYLVGFLPGEQWSYFPAVPELLITFGIVALEIVLYVAAVTVFPILVGTREPARA